jgi:hypothetical protein
MTLSPARTSTNIVRPSSTTPTRPIRPSIRPSTAQLTRSLGKTHITRPSTAPRFSSQPKRRLNDPTFTPPQRSKTSRVEIIQPILQQATTSAITSPSHMDVVQPPIPQQTVTTSRTTATRQLFPSTSHIPQQQRPQYRLGNTPSDGNCYYQYAFLKLFS